MKYLSYDIEIYSELYDETGKENDLKDVIPSVAAYCLDDLEPKYFYDEPYMSKETAKKLVIEMVNHYKNGIIPLTHNGLHFDFKLLAFYSGMLEECARLALNHIDIMFIVTCYKGYFIGLDTLLKGMGVEQKLHEVTLNDGSICNGFSGRLAPEMWRNGEHEAVKKYLAQDVISPIKLAHAIENKGRISWFSKTEKSMFLWTKLIPVKECFKIMPPNISWMTDPPSRKDFVDWIPIEIFREEVPNAIL